MSSKALGRVQAVIAAAAVTTVSLSAGQQSPAMPTLIDAAPGSGETVTRRPFTADAVTTITQVLPDGNRIERRFQSTIARDSAGRLRADQSIAMLGSMSLPGEPLRMVTITDPVGGQHYLLDIARQVATRRAWAPPREAARLAGGDVVDRRVDGRDAPPGRGSLASAAKIPAPLGGRGPVPAPTPSRPRVTDPLESPPPDRSSSSSSVQSLGRREIAGLVVQGSRITTTVPAGAVGNARTLLVVTERWVSSALDIPLEIVRRDPRVGETVYRVTRLVRGEPAADLFIVPPGFSLRDEPAGTPLPPKPEPQ